MARAAHAAANRRRTQGRGMSGETALGAKKTSGLAIASLVLACSSLVIGILGSIPAIVLGHIARRQIRKDPTKGGARMAMTGIIIGWVFTGLFSFFLAALLIDWATV